MSMLTPGIYVKEVDSGARPITAVGTSTAAFIGEAPLSNARVNEAVAITNWSQFLRIFVDKDSKSTNLSTAVNGFFINGGALCYVVNIGTAKSIAGDTRKKSGLAALAALDDINIVAAPGFADGASYAALIAHCEMVGNCFALLDPPPEVDDLDSLKKVIQADNGESSGDGEGESTSRRRRQSTGARPPSSDRASFYFPCIKVADPLSGAIVTAPPSGHVAGLYARTDSKRGVHKAPANEVIKGALGLAYQVTRAEQGGLNEAGVNCIRYFPDTGICVWGARTLSADAQWRYINVRRLFLMIKTSIERHTNWIVFEPNDEFTWKSIERDVRAFLWVLWRTGALKGSTPEQAFFVKCDAETNPPEVINAGQLITEIGIAPVKPAEFVCFMIAQGDSFGENQSAGKEEAAEA